ncbi:MAG: ribosome recycling factor [Acidobacteria bacterium]|nr:ribosome recycling factor [Acidobacteriota bacterium]MBI3655556.1 ribosome recycling factor [Acidobacteriota bacterium]
MIKSLIDETNKKMEKAIADLQRNLASVRTGRASIHLLDHVMADYYGASTPVSQLASLSTPEPTMILVQPWDVSALVPIERAIQASDLGVNPSNDGKVIRVPIPALTEERRRHLAKGVGHIAEDHRVAVRQVRHDSHDRLKKLLKDKKITEDDERNVMKKVQELTDSHIKKIDALAKAKEDEILKF